MAVITSDDLKAHLGIEDSRDDTTIDVAARSASAYVHEFCGNGREFDKTPLASPTVRVFRPKSTSLCLVDDFWETTALVVKTDDNLDGTYETTWVLDTDFIVEPLNGKLYGQTWAYYKLVALGTRAFPYPCGPYSTNRPTVQVTAAWGWAAVPDPVKQTALIQGARLFKRKTSPEGVLNGFQDFGPVRVSSRIDPDLEDNLTPYRRGVPGFA